jgi:hypothetical protein
MSPSDLERLVPDAPSPGSMQSDAELSAATQMARPVIARYFFIRVAMSQGTRGRDELAVVEARARSSISTVVRMLRVRGVPPERVLISVKEMLASLPQREHDVLDRVQQKIILWAIEEYYRAE